MSGQSSSLAEALGHPLRVVWRWGGRRSDHWRVVLRTHDPDEARAAFDRERDAMRQGILQLRRYVIPEEGGPENGTLEREATGPRLRTRW